MKDILLRLADWYNGGGGSGMLGSNSNPGSNSSGGGPSLTPTHMSSALQPSGSGGGGSGLTPEDGNVSIRQWNYCIDLAKHLYEVSATKENLQHSIKNQG
jgi:hypothetical protein